MCARAENNDANAQTALGAAYLYGWAGEKDEAKAVKWFQKAAEQGQALAGQNLDTKTQAF